MTIPFKSLKTEVNDLGLSAPKNLKIRAPINGINKLPINPRYFLMNE